MVKSKVIVWSYLSKQLQNICLNYFLSTFYLCHLYVILKRKDRRVRLPFEHWSLSRVHCKKKTSDNQNFSFKSCEILVTWGKIMKKENKAKPTPPPIILLYQPKGKFSVLRKKKKKSVIQSVWALLAFPLVLAILDCLTPLMPLWISKTVEVFPFLPHIFLSTPPENTQLMSWKLL